MNGAVQFATSRGTISFDHIERYWNDPAHRAQIDADYADRQRTHNARFDAALIASGNRWPAHWTDAEKAEASATVLQEKEND
jgi:hypothetical protein